MTEIVALFIVPLQSITAIWLDVEETELNRYMDMYYPKLKNCRQKFPDMQEITLAMLPLLEGLNPANVKTAKKINVSF